METKYKITPIELVEELSKEIKDVTSGGVAYQYSYCLEDRLFIDPNNSDKVMGELSLPVKMDFEEFSNGDYVITLWSEFGSKEFTSLFDLEEAKINLDKITLNHYVESEQMEIIISQGKNVDPYNLVMKNHIPKVLSLYKKFKNNPVDTLALHNLKKVLIDYK